MTLNFEVSNSGRMNMKIKCCHMMIQNNSFVRWSSVKISRLQYNDVTNMTRLCNLDHNYLNNRLNWPLQDRERWSYSHFLDHKRPTRTPRANWIIHTLAISVCSVSCDLRREYSSAITSEASRVSVGLMLLAIWIYFLINFMLTILSLKQR